MLRIAFFLILLWASFTEADAQRKTLYPHIPRIDVHAHVANEQVLIDRYLDLRDILLSGYGADLAMWINLQNRRMPVNSPDSLYQLSRNRMLTAMGDYEGAAGLKYRPEDLREGIRAGFTGYKIWYGPYYRRLEPGQKGFPYVDDPANEPLFAEAERSGILLTSIHIADPNGPFGNRTQWCADPVEFWREITAFHNVLRKFPGLRVVAAHAGWLICQDAQIDYLRYLLETFPNLNLDLAATFQYFYMVNHDNLRDFMMEYADRILFGTDISNLNSGEETKRRAAAYSRCFRILETDEMVEGGFFGSNPIKGLKLPEEILEKIYYKNAVRIYPGLRESMEALGYNPGQDEN